MSIVRLPTGDLRDEIRQPLYDSRIIDSTISVVNDDYRFFSDVQGKPKYITNLNQNNLLETAKSFRIQGLAIEAIHTDGTKNKLLKAWADYTAISLQVGEKVYFEGPLSLVGGRMYQDGAISRSADSTGADASLFLQQFGMPSCNAVAFGNKHFVDINPLQTFFVRMKTEGLVGQLATDATPSANNPVKFVCYLKGLLRRPVQ